MTLPITIGVEEVAEILKVHTNTVLLLAQNNEIDSVKIGKRWLFRPRDVEKFLDRRIRERKMGVGR